MIKCIFIDVDNTLLDFDGYVQDAMKVGFAKYGYCTYEPRMFDVFCRINNDFWSRHEKGEISMEYIFNNRWGEVFKALSIDSDGHEFEEFFRTYILDSAIEVDGAIDMLKYLHDRYILCAATNGPCEQQLHRLELGKMKQYFDYAFISEDLSINKPYKLYFDYSMDIINKREVPTGVGTHAKLLMRPLEFDTITPDEVLMIGDSLSSDMAGAVSAGFKTMYFNRFKREIPKDIKLDYVVEALRDVKKLI